jgi:hypothetical protein
LVCWNVIQRQKDVEEGGGDHLQHIHSQKSMVDTHFAKQALQGGVTLTSNPLCFPLSLCVLYVCAHLLRAFSVPERGGQQGTGGAEIQDPRADRRSSEVAIQYTCAKTDNSIPPCLELKFYRLSCEQL